MFIYIEVSANKKEAKDKSFASFFPNSFMRVLVTGALGFVGLNCVYHLASQKINVVALSRREPDPESLAFLKGLKTIKWIIGDVTDQNLLINQFKSEQITHVLHAAAMTASFSEEQNAAAKMFQVNAVGTLNILEASLAVKVKRVIFISSSGLYGPSPALPLKHESDPLSISGLYAICKQTSEHLCQRYTELYGLSTAVGRLGTTYGPMERSSHSRQNMSAIHQLAMLSLSKNHIKVHGSEIARDFCHSFDIASAFTALLLKEKLSYPIYNVAGLQGYPLSDAISAVSELNPDFSWEAVNNPEDADLTQTQLNARAGMSVQRLQEDTTWQTGYDLKNGMKAYLKWLMKAQ